MKSAFWQCLKSRLPLAALYLLAVGLFALVGFLTGAPLAGMLYAAVLCLAAGLCLTLFSVWRDLKRHRRLQALLSQPLLGPEEAPRAHGLLENDWRQIALTNLRERMNVLDQMERRQRDRDEYAALWTHQVKVPISAMRLLLQSGSPEPAALSAELLKIEQYVEMSLGYDRLSGSGSDYVLRRCEVNPIMLRCARRFAPLFIQKKLRLDYQPTSLTALTDEKWLAFVLDQLISNAVKYTRRGTVTLRADEKAETLVVEDTGIGIAPEDLPRIFEHGYTGLNGRLDKHATGLGLYLSRRVLEKLDHTIHIQSQVGRGTRVTVFLGRRPVDPAS